jgi:putative ABC transport system substrate-binding protein
MAFHFTRMRHGAIALIVLAALVAFVALRGAPRPFARTTALYVEEPAYEEAGRKTQAIIAVQMKTFFPEERVQWHFMVSEPTAADAVGREIARLQPSVVIFANDAFVPLLRQLPASPGVGFVVPSERPAHQIVIDFRDVRAVHQVAFISWDSAQYTKSLELASKVCGRPHHSLVAVFHEEYIAADVPRQFSKAASAAGLDVRLLVYRGWEDFEERLAEAASGRPDSLYVPISSVLLADLPRAADLVARAGIPAVHSRRDQVWAGGLVSADAPDDEAHEQMALYAGLILRGADASRLAVTQPSSSEIAVNLVTARRIGCSVPYELLMEAKDIVGP